jgi:hypothetical protein
MQLMRVHQSKFSHERELSTFYSNVFKYWLSLIQSPLKEYIFTGMNVNKAIFRKIL